ncbi:MAG: DNA helicase II [Desulfobulbus propionicus]|nr:MAG: DNA helicase II [Desulfobulbus propionicus]
MRYIADLHVHGRYSRATSKNCTLQGLAAWGAVKGIQVIGTGDFTHPAWFSHLSENLEEAEPGFFRLKKDCRQLDPSLLPPGLDVSVDDIRFVLTSEISSIYKRGGRVRKVHNLLFAPDFAGVQRVNRSLAAVGNIESDGRPILGLDSRDLLEITLEQVSGGFFVPAHIWTPWFSLFGSKSGFDAIEECFADLSGEVFALETGLSSDPEMNRRISALDRFTLISNSDCHSPAKLGREANVFDTGFDFFSMKEAIRSPLDQQGNQCFAATIEFYPEEGKYHCDGHRKCGICLDPSQSRVHDGRCPSCGKPLTIGVLHRVLELADREQPDYPGGSPAVHSLVPLPEVLGELLSVGPTSKKVMRAYVELIQTFGSEFNLLLNVSAADIHEGGSALLAEAVQRIRKNSVYRQPGFDGEFGVIRVFSPGEKDLLAGQLELFAGSRPKKRKKSRQPLEAGADAQAGNRPRTAAVTGGEDHAKKGINPEQEGAVTSDAPVIVVQAGPGTGKTHTLVSRVLRLAGRGVRPCTVITFTNKAVDEVAARIEQALGSGHGIDVTTFHRFCLRWICLRSPKMTVAGPELRRSVLGRLVAGIDRAGVAELDQEITSFLLNGQRRIPHARIRAYFQELDKHYLIDIEAVIPCLVRFMQNDPEFADVVRSGTGQLFVDEFQDLNRSQYDLICLLAKTCPLFAIGDPDQAIYGFRGADAAYFQRCIDELQAEVHGLVRNYRSGAVILAAAGAVIRHNRLPERSTMQAKSPASGQVFLCPQAGPATEARFIASEIERLVGGTSHRKLEQLPSLSHPPMGFSDIGVLYRTGRQAKRIVEALQDIPLQTVNHQAFYTTGVCRPFYLWLLVLAGRADNGMLLELLGREKGMGKVTLGSLEQVLDGNSSMEDVLSVAAAASSSSARAAGAHVGRLYQELLRKAELEGTSAVLAVLAEDLGADAEDISGEIQRLYRLVNSVDGSLRQVADHLLRFSDSVWYDEAGDAVTLATMHAAKGLEFRAVFLVGLEEDLCPLAPGACLDNEQLARHIEEERRLFYVGMTRAVEYLYLSWCVRRSVNGKNVDRTVSRFVREIPVTLNNVEERLLEQQQPRRTQRQLRLF